MNETSLNPSPNGGQVAARGVPPARLAAIILAAGRSTRMGRLKPLVEVGGVTLLARAVALFREAGVGPVIVVAGFEAERVCAAARAAGAQAVVHPDFDRGMFSSVQAGIAALAGADGFFLLPVDIALVRPATVSALAARFRPGAILFPRFGGRRGHPPLIDAALTGAITRWQGPQRLDAFLAGQEGRALDVAVADEAIGLDADTEEDLRALERRAGLGQAPSRAEALFLLEQVHAVDPRIVAHGRAVAAAATAIGLALNRAGGRLDLPLLESAALLHDIARDRPDHAGAGARLLADLGYPSLAEIVAVHMEIAAGEGMPCEAEVVHLADKLVQGERFVGLAARFDAARDRCGADPGALLRIESRRRDALGIAGRIERLTGRPIAELLSAAD